MNILLVDDSVIVRSVIKRAILAGAPRLKLNFLPAWDGAQALDILAAYEMDLVLVDWNMPVMNGLELVKRIRARGLQMPIVMISSTNDQARVQEAIQAGVTDYVTKPFDDAQLWQRLKKYFEGEDVTP
ncbi:MAG TPA: response regulator [Myxococcales bacterium]|nr:response regulator [Myxococcales bacterium]